MSQNITLILEDWRNGDDTAADRLFPLVYDELRRRAQSYLSRERRNHTLQPTALVHEAYLRLIDLNQIKWEDRAHFFALSATTMRRILVDHARELSANKRGGDFKRITLDNLKIPDEEQIFDLLSLNEALNKLTEIDSRKAQIVEMIYFAGMSQKEIAEVLQINEKTVQRDWNFAKLWLFRELRK